MGNIGFLRVDADVVVKGVAPTRRDRMVIARRKNPSKKAASPANAKK
jgi:hypothetical protein